MEWEQQNNEIDHKKVFIAAVVLIAIALAASAAYYFAVFKNGDALPKEEPIGQQLSEQEKAEIEKNLTSDTPTTPLSKKEKAAIEKNFINSGSTLTEEEKNRIEKNFGL